MPTLTQPTSACRKASNNTPSPKKLKTGKAPANAEGCLQLKWAVTNREDYHPPLLRQPYGVTIGDDVIATAEGLWPHSRLHLLDLTGHSKKVIGQGQILPYDVTFTPTGILAATDHRERTVKAFSQQGELMFAWSRNQFDWPNGIDCTSDGNIVIADWSKGQVIICDIHGMEIASFKTTTKSTQQLSCPDRVAVDTHGRVIVSDAYSGTVKVFSPTGELLNEFGNSAGPGALHTPKGVATDAKNNILVADWETNRIKLYDASGRWVKDLVTGDQGLKHPFALAWNDDISSAVITEHKLNSSPYLKMFSNN